MSPQGGATFPFAPGGPVYDRVYPALLDLFRRRRDAPGVAPRFHEWRRRRSLAGKSEAGDGPADEAVFVRHTCLAALSRLAARSFLGAHPRISGARQMRDALAGGFFAERGIDNFADDDFFAWPVAPLLAHEGLEALAPLTDALPGLAIDAGFLPELLRRTEGAQTLVSPLALPGPGQSVFYARCGDGAALGQTVRHMAASLLAQGFDEFDALLLLMDRVAAADPDPLSVALGRAACLFALDGLVAGPHPPIALPVYLSDGQGSRENNAAGEGAHTFHIGESRLEFQLPERVADDLQLLEWLMSRLPNYLSGAALRRLSQSEDAAAAAVLAAFHNYLLAPKPRTPVPEPLTPAQAEVMERTAEKLARLYMKDEDLFPLYLLKNAAASRLLARRRFDLTVAG